MLCAFDRACMEKVHYKLLIIIIVIVIIIIITISKVNADLKHNNNTVTIKKQLLSRGAFLYLGEDIGNANRVGTTTRHDVQFSRIFQTENVAKKLQFSWQS